MPRDGGRRAQWGVFLGGLIGWRGAFFCVVPVAVLVFLWLLASLPTCRVERRLPPPVRSGWCGGRWLDGAWRRSASSSWGSSPCSPICAHSWKRDAVNVPTLSLIPAGHGVTGFVGTSLIGAALRRSLYGTLVVIPALMAGIGLALTLFGGSPLTTALLLRRLGLPQHGAPVGWWTWLSRTHPQDAEAGGGLMVAVVQLAITLGATLGGLLFDLR